KAKGTKDPASVTVMILDRPRHQQMIDEIRAAGAPIQLITDGDVAGAIAACRPGTGGDMRVWVGGTPEGSVAACAIKALGGVSQGGLWPQDDSERAAASTAGLDVNQVLNTADRVTGDNSYFVATGVTNGDLLGGVKFQGGHV